MRSQVVSNMPGRYRAGSPVRVTYVPGGRRRRDSRFSAAGHVPDCRQLPGPRRSSIRLREVDPYQAGWSREKGALPRSPHQAPAGQPGFRIGDHRHDGLAPCPPPPWRRRQPCTPTGFNRDGINLTAAQVGGSVTGLDATGSRHRRLQPDQRQRRERPRRQLLRRRSSTATTSPPTERRQIGESRTTACSAAAPSSNQRRERHRRRQQDYHFQKNGIEVRGGPPTPAVRPATRPPRRSSKNVIPAAATSATSPRTAS